MEYLGSFGGDIKYHIFDPFRLGTIFMEYFANFLVGTIHMTYFSYFDYINDTIWPFLGSRHITGIFCPFSEKLSYNWYKGIFGEGITLMAYFGPFGCASKVLNFLYLFG